MNSKKIYKVDDVSGKDYFSVEFFGPIKIGRSVLIDPNTGVPVGGGGSLTDQIDHINASEDQNFPSIWSNFLDTNNFPFAYEHSFIIHYLSGGYIFSHSFFSNLLRFNYT